MHALKRWIFRFTHDPAALYQSIICKHSYARLGSMRQCLSVLAFVANSTTNHASHLPNLLRYRKGEYVVDFTAHFLCSNCQELIHD
jgi:hypothetical protein